MKICMDLVDKIGNKIDHFWYVNSDVIIFNLIVNWDVGFYGILF